MMLPQSLLKILQISSDTKSDCLYLIYNLLFVNEVKKCIEVRVNLRFAIFKFYADVNNLNVSYNLRKRMESTEDSSEGSCSLWECLFLKISLRHPKQLNHVKANLLRKLTKLAMRIFVLQMPLPLFP